MRIIFARILFKLYKFKIYFNIIFCRRYRRLLKIKNRKIENYLLI